VSRDLYCDMILLKVLIKLVKA